MQEKYKNSYKATEKELVSLSVYNVGYQNCDPGYQWGPGIRDHYLIHYIISGKGTYQVNDTTYELTAGDAFLVYPNTEIIYCANYSYPITVEDIAAYVGLSRSHLFRSFEDVVGQSPKEYLTDFRMKQACYLLEHSDLSITAIANSVGFDNGLYFSKTFRKKHGMPPKEYRQKKNT